RLSHRNAVSTVWVRRLGEFTYRIEHPNVPYDPIPLPEAGLLDLRRHVEERDAALLPRRALLFNVDDRAILGDHSGPAAFTLQPFEPLDVRHSLGAGLTDSWIDVPNRND